jgi:hypothetical protein
VWKWEDDIGMVLEGAQAPIVHTQPWLLPHHATPQAGVSTSRPSSSRRQAPDQIDTCVGADREREFPVFTHMQTTFPEDLASIGITTGDVDTVLCTCTSITWVGIRVGGIVPHFRKPATCSAARNTSTGDAARYRGYHAVNHLQDSIDPW